MPSVRELPRYPVTGGVVILAIGVTAAFTGGWDIGALTLDERAFWREPWRLLTSTLPHVGLLHILFNAYWTWRLGSAIEARFGHAATLAIMALLAVASGTAELAIFDGGVGLSGVGFGLLGVVMVIGKRDPNVEPVDRLTVLVFMAWFLVCIVTTITDVMPVANVAHGVGWATGLLVGTAIAGRGSARALAAAGTIALLVASILGATVLRPHVNLSPTAGQTSAWLGYRALLDDDPDAAVAHYERALALGEQAAWQYNYGLALMQTGDRDRALVALRRAVQLDPGDARHRAALLAFESDTPLAIE